MVSRDEHASSAGGDPAESGSRTGVTGVVLAGGRSTRFDGGDKALAAVAGTPMLARVVRGLGAVTDDVVVNCRPGQRAAFERALAPVDVTVRFAIDDRPDEGPLVGLDTALDAVSTPRVLVVACDLPFLDPELLDALLATLDTDASAPDAAGPVDEASALDAAGPVDEASAPDAAGPVNEASAPDAAVPVDDAGFQTPTCAAYRTDALASSVTDALAAGSRRLRDALAELDVRTVQPDALGANEHALADVDTRDDLDRLHSEHGTDDAE
jgi:molybdopterin-guanine dinucleotide biosynthesis protein A